ncbi:unnamed protein product [Brugia timori]|uniref:Virus ReqiPepy6 Gp37-like protein n=1 Tax=Brugia timori TaxID=42155 RepID=A0A0R3Q2X7_9BILA|nr:unnamed protein product [Brugia timori]
MNTTPLNLLQSAACVAPAKDIRYYLNGVWVMPGRVAACDGAAMIIIRHDTGADRPYFVPLEILKMLKADVTGITSDTAGNTALTTADGRTFTYRAEHMVGPFYNDNYLRSIPRQVSGELAQFNPEILVPFTKVGRKLGFKNPSITLAHNGKDPALVSIHGREDVCAIVMPYLPKGVETFNSAHSWEVGGRVYGFKRNEDDTVTPFDPKTGEEFPPLRKKVSGELWKVTKETGCHSLSWIVNFYFGTGGEIHFDTKRPEPEQKYSPKEILLAPPTQISDQEFKKLIPQTGAYRSCESDPERRTTMTITITIELGSDHAVGSNAIVTERRWFRKPTQTEYVCVGTDFFLGGEWVNNETDGLADEEMTDILNKAAQSEADRRLMDLRKEMGWF